ncbi:hypothetical protein BaRGS_00037484 [Batillaria attramentaria]|uniref:Transmembrane protein n=1 Tax=Batillaria attramentaria TaxID=370345 RepID=A0ABD0J8Y6_9CAEN
MRCRRSTCLMRAVNAQRERYIKVAARVLVLLFTACLISLLLDDAPLSRLLLASEDAERHRLLAENEERIQHSESFLNDYRASLTSARPARPVGADPQAEVGVTLLTMARGRRMSQRVKHRTQYLTQSLARLLQLLNDTSLTRSYRLSVCDVDDQPEEFVEARHLESLSVVPFFKRYVQNVTRMTAEKTMSQGIWEKLKHDYVYCLQQTMSLGVRYALLVEDDAVAHEQLLHVLEHVLTAVLDAPGAKPVNYVKLYHPKRLLGYVSLEAERLPELLALGVTAGTLGTMITLALSTRRRTGRLQPKVRTLWAWWVVTIVVFALAVGRSELLELRRLSPHLYQVTPAPSCCNQAMLYTQRGARQLSERLLNVTCKAGKSKDIWLYEFRNVGNARSLLVQPNLFTHIGQISTLRTKEVSSLIVP